MKRQILDKIFATYMPLVASLKFVLFELKFWLSLSGDS